jgi:predicted molibdopterin-dependent oxidoreductase YjgC
MTVDVRAKEARSTCPYCGVGCGFALARPALQKDETPQPEFIHHG